MSKSNKFIFLALCCICLLTATSYAAEETRTVVDSRGVEVQVPAQIDRVVTVSAGIIEGTMYVLGEADKIVAVGSVCSQKVSNYTITTANGTLEGDGGMNPVAYLSPRLQNLPLLGSGTDMNFEKLAGLDPDLVIIRACGCNVASMEDESTQKTIKTIEGLGIPIVVLQGPTCFDQPNLTTMSDEIRIIGKVFGKEERAEKLADYLESQTETVFERTKDIPDSEKQSVLIFGASPNSRKAGGSGMVRGTDTIESYFIEDIVHAKNAFRDTGRPTISAEQLLSLNPDAIVLDTANGYHPPEELYSAAYYQNVGELSAVKNRRVFALPWTCCSTKRLEYPIEVMVIAKAAYPDRFADIDLEEWLIDFFKNVYDVDDDTARALISTQWMDWCVKQ
ncbi:MAG TPA: ABC transporter substrate-binding protein [Methanothrix sp.]|nr:ABC transporter substrate-binding protein [Methanothrix sp.]